MSVESEGFDPYEAVLTDLKAKRDQIDQAIQLIEAVRGGVPIPGVGVAAGTSRAEARSEGPGAYLGMSIAEAAKKLLSSRKQALGNAEIVAALKAGGMAMDARDPINTVGSVLTRRFNQVGDIVRVSRGVWGLREWYPGRTFKKASKGEGENGEVEAIAEASEPNGQ